MSDTEARGHSSVSAEQIKPTVARVGSGIPASRAVDCARLNCKNDSTLKIGKQKNAKLSSPHIKALLAACSVELSKVWRTIATCAACLACSCA